MKNTHYCISVMIELIGIGIISFGLVEMFMFNCLNPVNFVITFGSLIFSIGSGIFAKWIKWNKET